MTDDDEIYTISFLNVDEMQEDGIQVAATMQSLVIDLHQVVLGNREVTAEDIHYYIIKPVGNLLQFARMATTIAKLQRLLETLQYAKNALEQNEDAEQILRDAWQLMCSVLSQEEIEKISASQIELRRSGIDPILVSGTDAWEQVNHILQQWSTPENEDQRVEYIVSYSDGSQEGRWLNLPLFYKMHSGDRFQIDPVLDLGERIIAALEKNFDVHSGNQGSFDAVRQSIVTYLRRYRVGGSACDEAVTTAIVRIQDEQWSPGIVYRRSLHSEHNQREGSL